MAKETNDPVLIGYAEQLKELNRKHEDLEKVQLKEVSQERDMLQQPFVELMQKNLMTLGEKNAAVPGVGTVFLHNKYFVSLEPGFTAIEIAKKHGLENMLCFKDRDIEAYCKEQVKNGLPLPEGIRTFVLTTVRIKEEK